MMKARSETNTINPTPALRRPGPSVLAALAINPAAVGALALLLGGGLAALAGNDNRAPEVPETIPVPAGNKVHFHGFAVGVQIYTWNGTDWGSAVPRATLFDGNGIVAIHFGGPTWESKSGSQVVGKLPPKSAIVDPDSIPWLLLEADPDRTHGPGILADTSFIHRVNTVGGKSPSVAGTFVGQVVEVPYTADYFFYRKTTTDE
jgi:hypothetical protein